MHFRFITNIRRTIKKEIVFNYWKKKKRRNKRQNPKTKKITFFCNSVNEKNKNRTGKNYRNIKNRNRNQYSSANYQTQAFSEVHCKKQTVIILSKSLIPLT